MEEEIMDAQFSIMAKNLGLLWLVVLLIVKVWKYLILIRTNGFKVRIPKTKVKFSFLEYKSNYFTILNIGKKDRKVICLSYIHRTRSTLWTKFYQSSHGDIPRWYGHHHCWWKTWWKHCRLCV